jgi:hypothetical protein
MPKWIAAACEVLVADADAKTRPRSTAPAVTTTPTFLLLMKGSLRDR